MSDLNLSFLYNLLFIDKAPRTLIQFSKLILYKSESCLLSGSSILLELISANYFILPSNLSSIKQFYITKSVNLMFLFVFFLSE